MFEVNIYVETSWKSPGQRKGKAAWLVEYQGKKLHTRDGRVELEEGTESQAVLRALLEAFSLLNTECEIMVHVQCMAVLSTLQNEWWQDWKANGWKNRKGQAVKNHEEWKALVPHLEKNLCSFETGHHSYQNVMKKWLE